MECDEIRPRIDASLDGALSSGEEREVRQHLETCAACRAEQEAVLAIRQSVRRAEYHRAPDALRSRIAAALEQESDRAQSDRTSAGDRTAQPPAEPRRSPRLGWLKKLWHRPASGRPAWPVPGTSCFHSA